LNPWFVTGFTDGEGSFGIYFSKSSQYQLGYQLKYEFTIALHKKDRGLLENIKLSFNAVGAIHRHGEESVHYRVSSMKDLSVILNHFDKHLLITQKRADYLLFKRVLELVQRKEHLTSDGFHEILSIKAAMNLGIPDSLKEAFPNV
ncbi:homing endonuclease, partial [Terfezia boudieri ATCC MYA-4762]